MNVRVVDDRGESLSTSRDLEQLQRDLQQEVAASFAEVRDPGGTAMASSSGIGTSCPSK
jgi:hypothetical protein